MIINQSTRVDLERLRNKIRGCSVKVGLNTVEIEGCLRECIKAHKIVKDKGRYKEVIDYLESLLSHVSHKKQGTVINLKWSLVNGGIVSSPIQTREFKNPQISFSNFIELRSDASLVCIDLTPVLDIISFELSYRDWGYSFKDIERYLRDVDGFKIHSISKLQPLLQTSLTYTDTKIMRIGDSAYYNGEVREGYSYFGSVIDCGAGYYRELLNRTRKEFTIIYLNQLLSNLKGVKLASLTETEVCLIVNRGIERIERELDIRVFGRYFRIELPMEVMEFSTL